MTFSYNRLWKTLIDRKMGKADLWKITGISLNIMTKQRRDEPVMLMSLIKYANSLAAIMVTSWIICHTKKGWSRVV